MREKEMAILVSFVIVLSGVSVIIPRECAAQVDIPTLYEMSLDWMLNRQNADGSWSTIFSDSGEIDTTAWMIIILSGLDDSRVSTRISYSVNWLWNQQDIDRGWNSGWNTRVMDTALCVWALAVAGEDVQSSNMQLAIDWLYAHQNQDWGWPYYDNSNSEAFVTFLVLNALIHVQENQNSDEFNNALEWVHTSDNRDVVIPKQGGKICGKAGYYVRAFLDDDGCNIDRSGSDEDWFSFRAHFADIYFRYTYKERSLNEERGRLYFYSPFSRLRWARDNGNDGKQDYIDISSGFENAIFGNWYIYAHVHDENSAGQPEVYVDILWMNINNGCFDWLRYITLDNTKYKPISDLVISNINSARWTDGSGRYYDGSRFSVALALLTLSYFGEDMEEQYILQSLQFLKDAFTGISETSGYWKNEHENQPDLLTNAFICHALKSSIPPDYPPDTTIISGPSGAIDYNDVTFTWTGTDDNTPTSQLVYQYKLEGYDSSWSGWTSSTTKSYNDLPNGEYTFKVKAKDNADQEDSTPANQTFTVFVDNPPDTTIISGPSGAIDYNDVTFTWTGTDDITPTNQLVYSYALEYHNGYSTWTTSTSENYNDLPEGSYTFKVKAKDNADQEDLTPAQKSFTIDTEPPITDHSLDPSSPDGDNGWYKSDVTVTLYASDGESGVSLTKFKIDDGSWNVYTGFFTVLSKGQHTVNYYSVDNAGNEETPKSVSFKIDKTDPATSHELNPSSPDGENEWYKSDVSITLNANDEASGVDYTKYKINTGSYKDYTGTISISSEGSHTLEYYSIDNAGNQETTTTVTIKIDKTNPETTHTLSPANPDGNNGWYKQDISILLQSNDDVSGVDKTRCKINEGNWEQDTGNFIWIRDDGIHTIAYYSKDTAGNEENQKTKEIKKDNTPPSAVIKKPEEGHLYLFDRELIPLFRKTIIIGRITIEVNADDAASGVDHIEFYVDDELEYDDTEAPYKWVYDIISILRHRHTIKTRVIDKAGNNKETEEIQVWICNL